MMNFSDQPIWRQILIVVEKLDERIGDFRLDEIIKEVQLLDPRRGRSSISPIVQGMTINAGHGPASPCGRPLTRISHGLYRLTGEVKTVIPMSNSIPKSMPRLRQSTLPNEVTVDSQTNSESLARGYLEFQEGQKGVSFDYLFGPYVQNAHLVKVIDPYIRQFHQAKNLMEFIETVRKFNSGDSEVSVKLITIEDEDPEKLSKQRDFLKQVQISADSAGIQFTFEFDKTRVLHDREVSTDTGWKIVLGRGLDIFQYLSSNAFEMANRMQSLRKVKQFGVSYIEVPTISKLKTVAVSASSFSTRVKGASDVVKRSEKESTKVDIILVSCVKTKRHEATAAKDLYISPLFTKARAYAEQSDHPWFILSAEHGLVQPDQLLAPYERYLPHQSSIYRESWGAKVVDELEQVEGSLYGKVIEIHAGSAYINAIRSRLQSKGSIILEPLSGLTMGRRLQWYGRNGFTKLSDIKQIRDTSSPSVQSLIALLKDESLAISPNDFLATGSNGRKVPGLYSWWVDTVGADELTFGLGHRVSSGLIYAGSAGATHWPSGKRSSNTLWLRISSMHLGASHEFSTFRRSLGAIIANAQGENEIDEVALTNWMNTHLRVLVVPCEDADSLGQLEQEVLSELDPPLNILGLPNSPIRRQLKELRRVVVK